LWERVGVAEWESPWDVFLWAIGGRCEGQSL
jgi:hypothetical protein